MPLLYVAERYDVLIADAFSGDAVPVHLLTEEAFRLYFRRLAPDGGATRGAGGP